MSEDGTFGCVEIHNGSGGLIGIAWGLLLDDENWQTVYSVDADVWTEGDKDGRLGLVGGEVRTFDTTVPPPDAALVALAVYRLTGAIERPATS